MPNPDVVVVGTRAAGLQTLRLCANLILFSAVMAWAVHPMWIGLAGLTAAIMISSAFTGFCPVDYLVNKFDRPEAPCRGRERFEQHELTISQF